MSIHKRGYAEEISLAIQQKISRLGFKEGDRLPPHAVLAEELNVSVPSLREGLQRLAALGLVKISHGSGTTVAKPNVTDHFQILNTILMASSAQLSEYIEVRKLIEPFIASQVAAQGGDFSRLAEIVEAVADAEKQNEFDRFRAEYIAFTRHLGELYGNSVISEVLSILTTLMLTGKDIEKNLGGSLELVVEQMRPLLEALKNGSADGAETAALEHIDAFSQTPMISIVCDTFSTGSIGGSFYAFGVEFCRVIRKYTGIAIESEPSLGGIENVDLTDEGKTALGLTQSDVAHQAFQGSGYFDKPHQHIRAICAGNYLDLWIVTADPAIRDLSDLRGKRIAMGTTGGESSLVSKAVLDSYGYSNGEYRPYFLSISNAVQGIVSGEIDVLFYLSDGPGSALAELSSEVGVRLLAIESIHLEKILATHTYWHPSVIESDSWPSQNENIRTIRVPTLLITHNQVPNETIETITEAVIDHKDEFRSGSNRDFRFGEIAENQKLPIPLHDGAANFFRKRGYNID